MMNYYAGIDIGASTTKAVIIDDNKEILGHAMHNSGADFKAAADKALGEAQEGADMEAADRCQVTATGYGRRNVPYADTTLTEISCHARGSYHFYPQAHTLIDIGGQDCKVIKIGVRGNRINFKMNRKCAAGTGAFLEDIANRLEIRLEDLNGLAEKASKNIQIGAYCTVFTATEILAKIRTGEVVPDIVKGIFSSVIKRALEMIPIEGDLVMSGGVVAHNPFLVQMFEEKIGRKIFIPPLPQMTGAFGAALSSLEDKQKEK